MAHTRKVGGRGWLQQAWVPGFAQRHTRLSPLSCCLLAWASRFGGLAPQAGKLATGGTMPEPLYSGFHKGQSPLSRCLQRYGWWSVMSQAPRKNDAHFLKQDSMPQNALMGKTGFVRP